MIRSLKREYQAVSTEKSRLKDFLKKQEEGKQKAEQESLIKKHAKQMDLYSKMLAMQNRRQKKEKNMIMEVTAATMKEVLRMTFMKNEKRDLLKKIT